MNDLENMIVLYAKKYYEGNQIVTDDYFDKLVEELTATKPDSEILKKVGWGCFEGDDTRNKESHLGSLVGSLEKIKYPEDPNRSCVTITPKIDGSSIVVYFQNGHYFKSLTRGNGVEGLNCSNKMLEILSRRKLNIPPGLTLSVRGEAYIPLKYHDELRERQIAHPRNYASGIMNRSDAGDDLRFIEFIAYSIRIISSKDHFGLKSGCIELLKSFGFDVINSSTLSNCPTPDILKNLYDYYTKILPVDGLVLTSDSLMIKSEGNIDYIAENSIAYKFEAERAKTTVESIEWGVGNTGRIVPVLKIKPINLSGAKISNVTAHNYENVLKLKIGAGSEVLIERSNEVIPYLVSVDPSDDVIVSAPIICPKCKEQLQRVGVDLMCPNSDCPTKVASRIVGFLDVIGIPDGLGPTYLEKWYSKCKNMTEFINMIKTTEKFEDVEKELGTHYGKLVWKMIEKVKLILTEGVTVEDFWKMTRIPGLGDSASRKMANVNPFTLTEDDIESLPDIPINVRQQLEWNMDIWQELSALIPIYENKKIEVKMKIAITGKMSLPRKEFVRILKNNNIIEAGIGKDTNYLVCNEPSGSSKYKFAKDNAIPIVTEKEFLDMVGIN
jgi:DNA ligase (NAD+)